MDRSSRDSDATPTDDDVTRRLRALRHAQRVLERELAALLRPDQVDAILLASVAQVAAESPADPAHRLRSLVGARLLDAVADLLGRAGREIVPTPARAELPRGELPTASWRVRRAS